MTKQYWADAITQNCVWLFQVAIDLDEENNCMSNWRTERVFLIREEALAYGKSRPYVWGLEHIGWRTFGVPCEGLMAEILGKHTQEFKDKVDKITESEEKTHNE